MMNFNFDFSKFTKDFLQIAIRKERVIDFLLSILKPVKTLFQEFNSFVAIKRDECKYNGRVISLRNRLVSMFGAGIEIELQEPGFEPYLLDSTGYAFNPMMGETGYALNPLLDESGTADLEGVDFLVKVPIALGADLNEVRGVTKKYAIPVLFNVIEV